MPPIASGVTSACFYLILYFSAGCIGLCSLVFFEYSPVKYLFLAWTGMGLCSTKPNPIYLPVVCRICVFDFISICVSFGSNEMCAKNYGLGTLGSIFFSNTRVEL